MDESPFQGRLPVLGSRRIPFQAPEVVGEKVYISSALVGLFHNANILLKALTLFFPKISTVLWKIVHVWSQKVQFDKHSCLDLVETLQFYSTPRWFPRKFVTTDFIDYQVDSLASAWASSHIGCFVSSLIWELSNIPALSFCIFIRGNFSWRKANPQPSYSLAFTKFFITPNLICKSESSILFDSTEGF